MVMRKCYHFIIFNYHRLLSKCVINESRTDAPQEWWQGLINTESQKKENPVCSVFCLDFKAYCLIKQPLSWVSNNSWIIIQALLKALNLVLNMCVHMCVTCVIGHWQGHWELQWDGIPPDYPTNSRGSGQLRHRNLHRHHQVSHHVS